MEQRPSPVKPPYKLSLWRVTDSVTYGMSPEVAQRSNRARRSLQRCLCKGLVLLKYESKLRKDSPRFLASLSVVAFVRLLRDFLRFDSSSRDDRCGAPLCLRSQTSCHFRFKLGTVLCS